MDQKQQEVAKNVSSGAEKVAKVSEEKAENTSKKGVAVKKTVKKKAKTQAKKPVSAKKKSAANKAKAEKARAQKRVEKALLKEERKAKKAERKAEAKKLKAARKAERQKRLDEQRNAAKQRAEQRKKAAAARKAEAKEKALQRKAERQKRRDMLKKESKAQRQKRLEKERAIRAQAAKEKREQRKQLALAKKEARLKKKEQRLAAKQRNRERRKPAGFGGWLAAVISLGATALALASIVTVGAVNFTRLNAGFEAAYRGTMYELIGAVDELDVGLSKARVSGGAAEQRRLLTNVALQARLAESDLEKLPLSVQEEGNVTALLNRTANAADRMLEKLARGEKLDEKDMQTLAQLYQTNHKVRGVLDELSVKMGKKDMCAFMKGKKGNVISSYVKKAQEGSRYETNEYIRTLEITEEKKGDELSSAKAEELCRGYFKDYPIQKVEFAGETISDRVNAYNFIMHDDKGVRLFAEISKSGELVGFDYYKPCDGENFDESKCQYLAETFLQTLGYDDMTAVWMSKNGNSITFEYAYEDDGVVVYPDLVQIKVCCARGVVTGMDASAFLRHHKQRDGYNAKIGESEARDRLNDCLDVYASRLAIIPARGAEKLCYEFVCGFDGSEYFVYVDAETGEETTIFLVEDSKQGKYIR